MEVHSICVKLWDASSCNKYWPEDGFMKPKHVAKSMCYSLYIYIYIDVGLWLNKILYEY